MRGEGLVLDGNAAAGLLQELLPFEMTTARTVCAGCAAVDHIGALRLYANGPGVVVRCLASGGVQLRVVGAEGPLLARHGGRECVEIEQLSE